MTSSAPASSPKIVVAGTGRAGTTLLMAILSDLGLDTGFPPGVAVDGKAGGLEKNIQRTSARIVKSPALSLRLRPLIAAGEVTVEHVIIPVRDLDIAAASRVRIAGYGRHIGVRGGLFGTRSATRQREVLTRMIYELVYTVAEFELPHTFLSFPRFATDWQYTYDKLGFLLGDIPPEELPRVMHARYDPTKIRQQPLSTSERLTSAALHPWALTQRSLKRVRPDHDAESRRKQHGAPPPAVAPATANGRVAADVTPPHAGPAAHNGRGRRRGRALLVAGGRPVLQSRAWQLWRAGRLHRATGPFADTRNEWSVIAAPDVVHDAASDELVDLALRAVDVARTAPLTSLVSRNARGADRLRQFPGQHYRLLYGLAVATGARRVVEVGTYLGASALAFLDAPGVEQLITFDIVRWDRFPNTMLRGTDFGGRLTQRIGDLSDAACFSAHRDDLAGADLLFVDASKDGVFEPAFLEHWMTVEPRHPQLLVLDDIRVLTMVDVWRELALDKLDLTSFGHWSGTGLVLRRPERAAITS